MGVGVGEIPSGEVTGAGLPLGCKLDKTSGGISFLAKPVYNLGIFDKKTLGTFNKKFKYIDSRF